MYFSHCYSVSIVHFEQVNAGWKVSNIPVWKLKLITLYDINHSVDETYVCEKPCPLHKRIKFHKSRKMLFFLIII